MAARDRRCGKQQELQAVSQHEGEAKQLKVPAARQEQPGESKMRATGREKEEATKNTHHFPVLCCLCEGVLVCKTLAL